LGDWIVSAIDLSQWHGADRAGIATPSGFPALDAVLPAGGWPNAGLSELLIALDFTSNAGCWALFRRVLPLWCAPRSQNTLRYPVLIGAPHAKSEPWLPGMPLPWRDLQWLWVRTQQVQHAYWAAQQALRCDDTGAIVVWLTALTRRSAHRFDEFTALRRLQALAVDVGKPVLVIRSDSAIHITSPAPLRLQMCRGSQPLQVDIQVIKRPGLAPSGWVRVDACSPRVRALMSALTHSREKSRKPRLEAEHETWPAVDRLLAA
jgi:hypothetical protein